MNRLNVQVVPTRPEEDHVLLGYIHGGSSENFFQPIILNLVEGSSYYRGEQKSILAAQYSLSSFQVDLSFTDSALASITSVQTGRIKSVTEKLNLKFNTKKIESRAVEILPGNTWGIRVDNGFMVDSYVVSGDETPSNYSWASLLLDDEFGTNIQADDTLVFIYSLPELYYKENTTVTDTKFPGNGRVDTEREIGIIQNINTIGYSGDLRTLKKIKINNVDFYSGVYDDTPTNEILNLDYNQKSIRISQNLSPQDSVILEYYSHPQSFVYTGFGSGSSWYGFDCNPEYSHKIKDLWASYTTSDLIDKQIALYLEPSAVMRVRFTPYTDVIGDVVGSLDIKCWSCFDIRPATASPYAKSCLKHKVYDAGVEFTLSRGNFNSANSWGFATLGVNYYDENTSSFTFDSDLPFCVPISKIFLSTVNGMESTLIKADNYGGGILMPKDEDYIPEEDLPILKSLLNVGTWGGGAYSLGGEVVVKVSATALNNCTEEEIYKVVKQHMPPDVVFTIKYI